MPGLLGAQGMKVFSHSFVTRGSSSLLLLHHYSVIPFQAMSISSLEPQSSDDVAADTGPLFPGEGAAAGDAKGFCPLQYS
jgi:hypothetical protein